MTTRTQNYDVTDQVTLVHHLLSPTDLVYPDQLREGDILLEKIPGLSHSVALRPDDQPADSIEECTVLGYLLGKAPDHLRKRYLLDFDSMGIDASVCVLE